MKCHTECLACTGPDLFHCTLCVHFKEEGKCVSNCSADFYYDSSNASEAMCLPCDQRCVHCTGPTEANCLACKHFKIYRDTVGHNSSVPVSGHNRACLYEYSDSYIFTYNLHIIYIYL